jgi:hypothetical protein
MKPIVKNIKVTIKEKKSKEENASGVNIWLSSIDKLLF